MKLILTLRQFPLLQRTILLFHDRCVKRGPYITATEQKQEWLWLSVFSSRPWCGDKGTQRGRSGRVSGCINILTDVVLRAGLRQGSPHGEPMPGWRHLVGHWKWGLRRKIENGATRGRNTKCVSMTCSEREASLRTHSVGTWEHCVSMCDMLNPLHVHTLVYCSSLDSHVLRQGCLLDEEM